MLVLSFELFFVGPGMVGGRPGFSGWDVVAVLALWRVFIPTVVGISASLRVLTGDGGRRTGISGWGVMQDSDSCRGGLNEVAPLLNHGAD